MSETDVVATPSSSGIGQAITSFIHRLFSKIGEVQSRIASNIEDRKNQLRDLLDQFYQALRSRIINMRDNTSNESLKSLWNHIGNFLDFIKNLVDKILASSDGNMLRSTPIVSDLLKQGEQSFGNLKARLMDLQKKAEEKINQL